MNRLGEFLQIAVKAAEGRTKDAADIVRRVVHQTLPGASVSVRQLFPDVSSGNRARLFVVDLAEDPSPADIDKVVGDLNAMPPSSTRACRPPNRRRTINALRVWQRPIDRHDDGAGSSSIDAEPHGRARDGQQSGSRAVYLANSTVISGDASRTAPEDPSSRDVISAGESAPANRPATNTKTFYRVGRHMPSAPVIPPTISTLSCAIGWPK